MKKDTLQVGTKDFSVTVDIDLPETMKDVETLAKGNTEYIIAKFTRGYRIDLQEGGARQTVVEMLAGKSPAQAAKDAEFVGKVKKAVVDEIKAFDSNAPRSRGRRPAVPQTVTLQPGKKQWSAAEVKAMLAGVKGVVVLED